MTPVEILSASSPERVFPRDPHKARELYKQLMQVWHPDKRGGREDVAAKLNELYVQHNQQVDSGRWDAEGVLSVKGEHGWVDVHYHKRGRFELGEYFVGPGHVTYEISRSYDDLSAAATLAVNSLTYADDKMRTEIQRYLPSEVQVTKTKATVLWRTRRSADQLMLRDVLDHVKKLDPVHVAWIISSCCNLGCYLKWANVVHNAPLLEALFISPQKHSVSLLGGWWYSVKTSQEVKALPTVATTGGIAVSKKPSHQVFLNLVKRSARELLGDADGSSLLSDLAIPNALLKYLQVPARADPLEEYHAWKSVLDDAYGARKFHVLNLTPQDIYK